MTASTSTAADPSPPGGLRTPWSPAAAHAHTPAWDGAAGAPDGWTRLRAGRSLPTRRGLLQLLLAVVLYGAGANAGAGWVLVLTAALAGAVLAGWLTARRTARRVEARRDVPPLVVAGSVVRLSVEVRAPGAGYVVVRDGLSGRSGAGAGGRFDGQARPSRGALQGAEIRVEVTDLLGLARCDAVAFVGSPLLAVPPVPDAAAAPWAAPAQLAEHAATVRARPGVEFAGLRAYAPGDPARSVQWRATARHGRLLVGEPQREAAPAVRVALAGGTWERGSLDRATERICALATAAEQTGHPVEVAVDGLVLPWSDTARRDLALLPPHAGAPARALAPPSPTSLATWTVSPADVADPDHDRGAP